MDVLNLNPMINHHYRGSDRRQSVGLNNILILHIFYVAIIVIGFITKIISA